ncbi:MAG: endolytic transglycosylase MltG [Candidatus Paceibacterota bacterium]
MQMLFQNVAQQVIYGLRWLGDHPWRVVGGGSIVFSFALATTLIVLILPSPYFPTDEIIHIEEGTGLNTIALTLEQKGVIRSASIFRYVIAIRGNDKSIVSGDYYLEKPLTTFDLADRLVNGHYNMKNRVVLIPEGYNVFQMAKRFDDQLIDFDVINFIKLARPLEGRLFPDTYEVQPTISEERLIEKMHTTFKKRIEELDEEIQAFDKSLNEIIIMASILEREAYKMEDRRRIAGVLWHRIEIGMPLQVDAVFSHVNGKHTYQLTSADLLADDPFNTYTRKGLPPAPIANPGLSSIEAAVTPVESNDLFFLSDRSGNMYYSETHDEHVRLKNLYVN